MSIIENNRKEANKTRKMDESMHVLFLEVLHYLVVYKDLCINIDIDNITVYVWGRNL
jgi:hypothetical protein